MNKSIDPITLLRGDCLEILPTIADKSVDAVICDLPYGTTSCKWDVVIPFAPLWEQFNRVCKGAIVIFGSQPFTSTVVASNMAMFSHEWIWSKSQGVNPLNARKCPMKSHENILVFKSKGGKIVYNPQMEEGKPYGASGIGKIGEIYDSKNTYHRANNGTRYPKSVIQFQSARGNKNHPTQKPVALLEYLIKTYTNEGDCVLDCTMGSGSTMVACVNANRRGIGIELMQEYYDIAVKRVKDAQAQLKLDLFI